MTQLVHGQRQRRQRGVGGDHRRAHGRRGRRIGGNGVQQGKLVGILDAQVKQPPALDLQHFDVEHDFGLGQVLHRDQLLGQPDGVGRVAHHQQIQPVVDIHVPRLDQRAQHGHGGLGIGIAQVEALHHQVLVGLLFLRLVGIDQQRIGVDHFLGQLTGHQEHVHCIGDRRVAGKQRGLGVRPHVLVENEIEARLSRDHVEHAAQRRIAELQRDRLAIGRPEFRQFELVRCARGLDLLQQCLRAGVAGGLGQDQARGLFRFVETARRKGFASRLQARLVLARCGQIVQQGVRTRVLGMDRHHFVQPGLRRVEASGVEVRLGLGEQLAGDTLALGVVISLEFEIIGLFGHACTQAGNAGFGLAGVDQLAAFGQPRAGAAGEAEHQAYCGQANIMGALQLNLLCAGCASGSAVGK